MDNRIEFSIADNFSKTPGPRLKDEGDFSGESLRLILEPIFLEAVADNKKVVIDLDRTAGYGTSFLEEVFGGLARDHGVENVMKIDFISQEEPYLIDDINDYINKANE